MHQVRKGESEVSIDISVLLGKTLIDVTVGTYETHGDDKDCINFTTSDHEKFMMYHSQDCCEKVTIEDINGELNDLLNSQITMAEKVTNATHECIDQDNERQLWTFYKLATVKGYVTIRWYGYSNGYYSEEVDFVRVER